MLQSEEAPATTTKTANASSSMKQDTSVVVPSQPTSTSIVEVAASEHVVPDQQVVTHVEQIVSPAKDDDIKDEEATVPIADEKNNSCETQGAREEAAGAEEVKHESHDISS